MQRNTTWTLRSVRSLILLAVLAFGFEGYAEEVSTNETDALAVSETATEENSATKEIQPVENQGEKLPSWVDDQPAKIDLSKAPAGEICYDPELVASSVAPSCKSGKRVEFGADFQTVFFIKNDEDFDDTPPEYNKDSQQSAFLGTYLRPRVVSLCDGQPEDFLGIRNRPEPVEPQQRRPEQYRQWRLLPVQTTRTERTRVVPGRGWWDFPWDISTFPILPVCF